MELANRAAECRRESCLLIEGCGCLGRAAHQPADPCRNNKHYPLVSKNLRIASQVRQTQGWVGEGPYVLPDSCYLGPVPVVVRGKVLEGLPVVHYERVPIEDPVVPHRVAPANNGTALGVVGIHVRGQGVAIGLDWGKLLRGQPIGAGVVLGHQGKELFIAVVVIQLPVAWWDQIRQGIVATVAVGLHLFPEVGAKGFFLLDGLVQPPKTPAHDGWGGTGLRLLVQCLEQRDPGMGESVHSVAELGGAELRIEAEALHDVLPLLVGYDLVVIGPLHLKVFAQTTEGTISLVRAVVFVVLGDVGRS